MTRDQLTDEAEDMLFHTRGMSRREQAVALVNTLFWPELAEARAKALDEAVKALEAYDSAHITYDDVTIYTDLIRALKDRAP